MKSFDGTFEDAILAIIEGFKQDCIKVNPHGYYHHITLKSRYKSGDLEVFDVFMIYYNPNPDEFEIVNLIFNREDLRIESNCDHVKPLIEFIDEETVAIKLATGV